MPLSRILALNLILTGAASAGDDFDGVRKIPELLPLVYSAGTPARLPCDPDPVRDESWRAGAALPPLLTSDLLTYEQVCKDARKRNEVLVGEGRAPRPFALVLAKMHTCDYISKACIHAARTFFDPCNRFIADNFIPYHARTRFDVVDQPDGTRKLALPEGGEEMIQLYETPEGPRLVAIDLETCRPVPHTQVVDGKETTVSGIYANADREVDGVPAWKHDDPKVRFAEMRSRLKELLSGASQESRIPKEQWEKPASGLDCTEAERAKAPVMSSPVFNTQLRQLMNEQYTEVTGKVAPVKLRWPVDKSAPAKQK